MRRRTISILVVAICAAVARAQSGSAAPTQVVEAFLKFETQGGRLTPGGWQKGNSFFSRPVESPKKMSVVLASKNYSVDEISVTGIKAEVNTGYDELGRIDPELRFTPPDPRYMKHGVLLHLVRNEVPPESHADAKSSGWKIDDPPGFLFLFPDAAVRYVDHVRTDTKDPQIRKNAEKTIAILKRFH